MSKKLKVLLVDEHPIYLDSYKTVFDQISEEGEYEFSIRRARDCDTANYEIENAANGTPFDLVFLDIKIPPSKDKEFLSGEDLGLKIRELFNDVQIIVFTTYTDNYRLSNILKSLNPDGFLVKKDVSITLLKNAIEAVLKDPPFYSKAVIRLLRQHILNDIPIDRLDRKLLYHLSLGFKMRELGEVLPLSRGGIDKRKRKLMDIFEVEDHQDSTLIKMAKARGFI